MLNEFGLEGSPGRPVLLRILHFPGQVASLWGSIQGIFQFFFAPPCFWFALAWPISWGFPLCNSLPSLEDRWSSETASYFSVNHMLFISPDIFSVLFCPISQLSNQSLA